MTRNGRGERQERRRQRQERELGRRTARERRAARRRCDFALVAIAGAAIVTAGVVAGSLRAPVEVEQPAPAAPAVLQGQTVVRVVPAIAPAGELRGGNNHGSVTA